MKFKTTKKTIMNGYDNIISIGYCNLQNLLNNENPIAYTARAEGWGSDIYVFDNTAIVTGYAPFGNIKVSYDIQRKYNQAAEIVVHDYTIPWADKKPILREMINMFINEVIPD